MTTFIFARQQQMDACPDGCLPDVIRYMPCVELGEVMRALGCGEVVESKYEGLAVGDKVVGVTGLQDYIACAGAGMTKLDAAIKAEDALSVFGVIIGLTAYHGIMKICKPKVRVLARPCVVLAPLCQALSRPRFVWTCAERGYICGVRSCWRGRVPCWTDC